MSRSLIFSLIGSSSHLSKGGSIHIFVDDVPLDNVDSYTYLGIVINNRDDTQDTHGEKTCIFQLRQ